ncbi:conserved Plasmodium protein, unknown function [Plasmodium ovale wallikeri]|uniref:Uncharacterized protein n=2 Tax=Plasmodium ovale TaxID=36330 RepID=A0A1A8YKT6_PLAOA|nr:conserved Plasmodium protein, unknown function [Plasmodium ovale wallikeri]SBT32159.1 conserved Plasmodium protein, unknown function [Plasmodium ovale wallikeri]SBT75650.1 conserved Plasmodium protein, unknown function [Plasmodium ovale]
MNEMGSSPFDGAPWKRITIRKEREKHSNACVSTLRLDYEQGGKKKHDAVCEDASRGGEKRNGGNFIEEGKRKNHHGEVFDKNEHVGKGGDPSKFCANYEKFLLLSQCYRMSKTSFEDINSGGKDKTAKRVEIPCRDSQCVYDLAPKTDGGHIDECGDCASDSQSNRWRKDDECSCENGIAGVEIYEEEVERGEDGMCCLDDPSAFFQSRFRSFKIKYKNIFNSIVDYMFSHPYIQHFETDSVTPKREYFYGNNVNGGKEYPNGSSPNVSANRHSEHDNMSNSIGHIPVGSNSCYNVPQGRMVHPSEMKSREKLYEDLQLLHGKISTEGLDTGKQKISLREVSHDSGANCERDQSVKKPHFASIRGDNTVETNIHHPLLGGCNSHCGSAQNGAHNGKAHIDVNKVKHRIRHLQDKINVSLSLLRERQHGHVQEKREQHERNKLEYPQKGGKKREKPFVYSVHNLAGQSFPSHFGILYGEEKQFFVRKPRKRKYILNGLICKQLYEFLQRRNMNVLLPCHTVEEDKKSFRYLLLTFGKLLFCGNEKNMFIRMDINESNCNFYFNLFPEMRKKNKSEDIKGEKSYLFYKIREYIYQQCKTNLFWDYKLNLHDAYKQKGENVNEFKESNNRRCHFKYGDVQINHYEMLYVNYVHFLRIFCEKDKHAECLNVKDVRGTSCQTEKAQSDFLSHQHGENTTIGNRSVGNINFDDQLKENKKKRGINVPISHIGDNNISGLSHHCKGYTYGWNKILLQNYRVSKESNNLKEWKNCIYAENTQRNCEVGTLLTKEQMLSTNREDKLKIECRRNLWDKGLNKVRLFCRCRKRVIKILTKGGERNKSTLTFMHKIGKITRNLCKLSNVRYKIFIMHELFRIFFRKEIAKKTTCTGGMIETKIGSRKPLKIVLNRKVNKVKTELVREHFHSDGSPSEMGKGEKQQGDKPNTTAFIRKRINEEIEKLKEMKKKKVERKRKHNEDAFTNPCHRSEPFKEGKEKRDSPIVSKRSRIDTPNEKGNFLKDPQIEDSSEEDKHNIIRRDSNNTGEYYVYLKGYLNVHLSENMKVTFERGNIFFKKAGTVDHLDMHFDHRFAHLFFDKILVNCIEEIQIRRVPRMPSSPRPKGQRSRKSAENGDSSDGTSGRRGGSDGTSGRRGGSDGTSGRRGGSDRTSGRRGSSDSCERSLSSTESTVRRVRRERKERKERRDRRRTSQKSYPQGRHRSHRQNHRQSHRRSHHRSRLPLRSSSKRDEEEGFYTSNELRSEEIAILFQILYPKFYKCFPKLHIDSILGIDNNKLCLPPDEEHTMDEVKSTIYEKYGDDSLFCYSLFLQKYGNVKIDENITSYKSYDFFFNCNKDIVLTISLHLNETLGELSIFHKLYEEYEHLRHLTGWMFHRKSATTEMVEDEERYFNIMRDYFNNVIVPHCSGATYRSPN